MPEDRLLQMTSVTTRHHETRTSAYVNNKVAVRNFRFVDSFESPADDTTAQVNVFLDGYLVNRKEVIDELTMHSVECRNNWCDETLTRLAYRLMGTDLVELLRGVFNVCAFDKQATELTLFNCRHGARHLYYTLTDRFLAFATEPGAIAALGHAPHDVDRHALCDMFNFGYISGCRTLFSHIQLLEHANVLSVSSCDDRSTKYWDYRFQNNQDEMSFSEYVDQGIDKVDHAIATYIDRFGKNIGVPLSGGLDSRSILAFASQYIDSVDVFHCAWYLKEQMIAKRLSDVCRAEWHQYDPLRFDYDAMLNTGFRLSDGAIHAHQFWFIEIAEDIAATGELEVLLDGYLMDVLLGDTFLVLRPEMPVERRELRSIVNRIWRRGNPFFAKQIFLPAFFSEYEKANIASIDANFEALDETNISNLIHKFSLENRSNRYSVAMPNVQRQFVEYGFPGLEYDFVDFCLRIPPELKKGAALYREMLHRRFPEVAEVPWAKTGRPLSAGKSLMDRAQEMFPLKALGSKLLFKATGGRFDISHRGDLNLLFRKDASFRNVFTTILRDHRTHSRGIVDSRGSERLVDLIDRGWPLFTFVQTLATVELWYRKYVDG